MRKLSDKPLNNERFVHEAMLCTTRHPLQRCNSIILWRDVSALPDIKAKEVDIAEYVVTADDHA